MELRTVVTWAVVAVIVVLLAWLSVAVTRRGAEREVLLENMSACKLGYIRVLNEYLKKQGEVGSEGLTLAELEDWNQTCDSWQATHNKFVDRYNKITAFSKKEYL